MTTISKLEVVLIRLRKAGLKVNTAKSFFCTHMIIVYLGYINQREDKTPAKKDTGNTRAQPA
jgi:hypothetical protein